MIYAHAWGAQQAVAYSNALRDPGSTETWGPQFHRLAPKGQNWKPEVLRVEVGLSFSCVIFLARTRGPHELGAPVH